MPHTAPHMPRTAPAHYRTAPHPPTTIPHRTAHTPHRTPHHTATHLLDLGRLLCQLDRAVDAAHHVHQAGAGGRLARPDPPLCNLLRGGRWVWWWGSGGAGGKGWPCATSCGGGDGGMGEAQHCFAQCHHLPGAVAASALGLMGTRQLAACPSPNPAAHPCAPKPSPSPHPSPTPTALPDTPIHSPLPHPHGCTHVPPCLPAPCPLTHLHALRRHAPGLGCLVPEALIGVLHQRGQARARAGATQAWWQALLAAMGGWGTDRVGGTPVHPTEAGSQPRGPLGQEAAVAAQ